MERRLAAILAADMVGYSRLMAADETGTIDRQRTHRTALIDPKIAQYGGRIVKTTGDGMLVEFPSVVDAVQCAVEIQRAMTEREAEVPDADRIRYRIGINLGDIVIDGDDILGDGVNIAARLEGVSDPEGLCISDVVYQNVQGKLDLTFDDLGHQVLKNMERKVRAWKWMPAANAVASDSAPAPGALSLPDKPSIAVLPFTNMSGDPEQEYFADGVTEDLITALSLLRWFFVIARNSTFVFKGQAVDVKQVAQKLGVRYVVEGSVRKAGNRVRINVQLIDALSGSHVWADRYDLDLVDIFEVQDVITQSISAAIEPQLLAAEAVHSNRRTGKDLDAWDLVMRARAHYWKMTEPETKTAIGLLEQAIALNPEYGPAHSALAFQLLFTVHMGWILADDTREAALASSRRAIEIDDLDPWAHVSLGYLAVIDRDTDKAAAAFSRAIDLNPNFAAAFGWRGLGFAFGGRSDEAIPDLEQALRLSPRDPQNAVFTSATGIAHYLAGRYEEAVVFTGRAVEMRPGFVAGHRIHCAALVQLDRLEEARQEFSRVQEMQPNVSAHWLRATVPYAQPKDMEHFLDGLRIAGLPE